MSGECTAAQIRVRIDARVDAEHPDTEFGSTEGAIPQQILAMLEAQEDVCIPESAFEMKQATMPDIACQGCKLFEGVRPTVVTAEGETANTFSKEAVAKTTVSDMVSALEV